MTPKEKFNSLLAVKVIGELQKRNIEGLYFGSKEEALRKVIETVPAGSSVSWSGSVTLKETGILDALKNGSYRVLDASDRSRGPEEMNRIAHEALNADYYFLSANAISATGEIINLDGIGNRASSLLYGPKNVIIVAGINKVEQTLDLAMNRARTVAAPLVVLNYMKEEPRTFDELISKARDIISQTVVTSMSVFKNRIRVFLVGEVLGF